MFQRIPAMCKVANRHPGGLYLSHERTGSFAVGRMNLAQDLCV